MVYDRIWPHWMGEREVKAELDRLEREYELAADEYADEHRADQLAAGLDEYEVGVA